MCGLLIPIVAGCNDSNQRAVIAGGSMAPRLYGQHYQVICKDCRLKFNVDTKVPKQKTFACPNCGFADNKVPTDISKPDQVEVQLNSTNNLDRWDLVAIKRGAENYHVVKRVIGLPGETVQIKNGDILINNERVKMTLDEQRTIRIPVHDTKYHPADNLFRRWRPDLDSSGWSMEQEEFVFTPAEDGLDESFDWLTYHHWRGFHHRTSRMDEFPIEDSYAFNQAINRSLVAMNDLYLEIQLAAPIKGELAIRLWRGEHVTEIQFDGNRVLVGAAGPGIPRAEFAMPEALNDICTIEVSSFDSKLQVAVNGNGAFIKDVPLIEANAESSKYSFQIGARYGVAGISRLRVFRDIYYRNLIDAPADGFQLSENEYFFLGDNVPVSIDSRHWPTPVRRSEILGRISIGAELDSFVP